ncbi:MAG: ATP-binding protein, partial [Opitutaceae bacterium]
IAPDLRRINGDATQIHQVLLNLCVNARDAMPDGGALRLGAYNAEVDATLSDCVSEPTPGSYVCLSVTDGGTGMPAHIRSQIFDPFFTTKGPGKGSGLGLSTVLGIVRSHGGFLRLQSDPGRGSRFEVYLPAAFAETAPEPVPAEPVPSNLGRGRRILVVDDEQLIREACASALSNLGFTVVEAEDGKDALVRAREEGAAIQLVITDLDMPILGGRGLIEALRSVLPDTPIIVMSGIVAEAETAFLRKDPRVRSVVQKPFSFAQVVAAVAEAPARAPARGAV